MKKENFDSRFLLQQDSLANHGYQNNELLNDPSVAVRVQALLNGADPARAIKDSSQQVRFTAVNELEKILSCTVPQILFDQEHNPYVVSSPERDALQILSSDISPMVHISAEAALNRIKEKELKETVSLILKQHGLYELALSLGMDFNNSLLKKLIGQEIVGLPTDKEIQNFYNSGKAGIQNREVRG